MFYIGQEIVAIKTVNDDQVNAGIIKGVTYVVKGFTKQCKCSGFIDVGIRYNHNEYDEAQCGYCGSAVPNDGILGFAQEYFVPVDYSSAKQVTFREIDEPVFAN